MDTKSIPLTGGKPDEKPDNLSPAVKPAISGATQEPEIADRIDMSHPAVDAEPRKGLPPESNQVDFNDPTIPGHEAVRRNLEAQGIPVGRPQADAAKAEKPA